MNNYRNPQCKICLTCALVTYEDVYCTDAYCTYGFIWKGRREIGPDFTYPESRRIQDHMTCDNWTDKAPHETDGMCMFNPDDAPSIYRNDDKNWGCGTANIVDFDCTQCPHFNPDHVDGVNFQRSQPYNGQTKKLLPYDKDVTVLNLATGEETIFGPGMTPQEAVVSAYLMSIGDTHMLADWETRYQARKILVYSKDRKTVGIGDFAARL